MTDATPDELDAIAAALARVRGRGRGPGGPGSAAGAAGRHGHPAHEWLQGEAGSGSENTGHGRGRGARHPGGPGGPGSHWGGPGTWAGAGRMGGPARMRLLDALAVASGPMSVSEVGEAVGVDQPRASRLIQQAVDLGLVRREADPDDARRTRVALTDEGTRIVRGFRGQRREHLSQALADFTADERADLARLLTKLAASWPSP